MSPSQAPTARDFLKLSGSSMAVAKDVAVIAPTPGIDIRMRQALGSGANWQQADARVQRHVTQHRATGAAAASALTGIPPDARWRRKRASAFPLAMTSSCNSIAARLKSTSAPASTPSSELSFRARDLAGRTRAAARSIDHAGLP